MSATKIFGKDTVIFATKEDHAVPSKIELPSSEAQPGLLLPSGDINWNCPCLGGMATGPCGVEFREAFSCFHYSDAEPKGSDCYETFKTMQDCMSTYPTVYNHNTDDNLGIDLDAIDLDGDEDDLSGKKGSSRREVEYADGEDADDIKTEVKKEVELAAK